MDKTCPLPSPVNRSFIADASSTFFTLLTKDTIFAKTASNQFGIRLLRNIAFAFFVWILYALRLCPDHETACVRGWIVGAPFIISTPAEARDVLAEYVCLYVGVSLAYQAVVCGIPQTFRSAAGATRGKVKSKFGNVGRFWIYLHHVYKFGCRFILLPLLILAVSQGMGKTNGSSRTNGALSYIYTASGLHLLDVLCETVEQLSYRRAVKGPDLKMSFAAALLLAVTIRNGHWDSVLHLVQSSWDGARRYSNTARIAKDSLRKRAAHLNTM